MSKWGYSWTIGCTFGFEFIDENFLGGGVAIHLGFFRVIYMKNLPLDFDD
jgi:hypothetical protein